MKFGKYTVLKGYVEKNCDKSLSRIFEFNVYTINSLILIFRNLKFGIDFVTFDKSLEL